MELTDAQKSQLLESRINMMAKINKLQRNRTIVVWLF
jgi:hypothetical protein